MKSESGPWQKDSEQGEQQGKDPEARACQASHAPRTTKGWGAWVKNGEKGA